ncbi:MAG TPA: 23S rRNA (guanosine(2251)-2'-O)-methyltransferase RlmB [Clostridia bacterium]
MTKPTDKRPDGQRDDLLAGRKPRRIPAASAAAPHTGPRRPSQAGGPSSGFRREGPPRTDDRRPPFRSNGPRDGAPASGDRRPPFRSNGPRDSAPASGDRRPPFRSNGPREGFRRDADKPQSFHAERDESRDRPEPDKRPTFVKRPFVPAPSFEPSQAPAADAEDTREIPEGWLEGRNPIMEALRAGRTINKMWVLKPKTGHPDPTLGRLVAQARETGAVVLEVERDALDRMAFSKGHQGVIVQAAAHAYATWEEVMALAKEKGEDPLVLVLDELKDPYNLGSILRIADAAGVHGVIIPARHSVGLDALTAKASAGAIEHVPVVRVVNIVTTLESMKKEGFWIAGTDTEGGTPYDQADYQGPTAIVVGSEGEGLGRLVREHCDFLLSIPMKGKVNSLNVAVATGVVVFEALRRRALAQPQVQAQLPETAVAASDASASEGEHQE